MTLLAWSIVRKLPRNLRRNARNRPDRPLTAAIAAVTSRLVTLHHDACICGACRSARAGEARRLELAERSREYSRPTACGCGCGELVIPGPTGQRYATNACRQRSYRRRRAAAAS